MPVELRLGRQINFEGPTPEIPNWSRGRCWQWEGTDNGVGYGLVSVEGRKVLAHLLVYKLLVGKPIPRGHEADHLCRNTRCVNPMHLEIVLKRVNLLRGVGWAGVNARKTNCPRGHPLIEGNLVLSRLKQVGWRECLTCKRERVNERAYENRLAAKIMADVMKYEGAA